MEVNNNNQVEQEEKQQKRLPYESASESCFPLNSLVPISFAKEQIFFNRTLKVEVGDVDEYVKIKLKYDSVDSLCKAFAREQIDAIATAIYNWEATGNAIIVSDQTGLGKGRIVAGLIRYSLLTLKEYPIFFTEKKNLFSDIYRDLYDIGLDASIPIKIKKQVVEVSEDDLTDDMIIKQIKRDIKEGELRVDYPPADELENLKDLLKDEDMVDDLLELYRQHILENGIIEGREYEKVDESLSDTQIKNLIKNDIESIGTIRFVEATKTQIEQLFDKSQSALLKNVIEAYQSNLSVKKMTENAKKENRIRVFPFCPFDVKIKNKQGDVIYEVSVANAKSFIESKNLDAKYREQGLMLMLYTTLQRGFQSGDGKLMDKGKFIVEKTQNRVIILDEAHNSAGQSNRFRIMSMLLRGAKYVSYVSATWAKRPDNMPIYAVRTAIKDSYLSTPQIINAFRSGGLALQEAVSSNLVQDGQLIRREKEIDGQPIYYTESDKSEVGLNQISRLNSVASTWAEIMMLYADWNKAFRKAKESIDTDIEGVEEKEARKRFKIAGKVNRQLFLLFNYFLLGLKVRQASEKALEELQNGRKVVLAIANTLESALSNIKSNYEDNIGYDFGDRVPNDFSELLKYMASYMLQIRYEGVIVNDLGENEEANIKVNLWEADLNKSTGNDNLDMLIRTLKGEWTSKISELIQRIGDFGLPLSPIDQIKSIITKKGFSIDEITGRTKMLEFTDADDYSFGVLSKRKKTDKMDIINRFNSNELDAVIINQSGSTGLSLHALPTMNQGKIVPPVNVVPPIPPNSLLPKNEVKQRCMIILQMELNISTEVQKLGRVNRNGQVFPPKYIYIVSAIPSEARLSAMMQRKLQSLMATAAGNQEFGEDLFSYDDFFSDNAVDPWNETCDEYNLPPDIYHVKTGDDIYQRTKLFYLMNYDRQKNFYFTFSNKLKAKIAELRKLGQYFQAIQYKDYQAVSKQLIPFIIGNNDSLSVFGKHTFAELVEVTQVGDKNYESIIKREISANKYILQGGNSLKFPTDEQFVEFVEKSTEQMITTYNSDYLEANEVQRQLVEGFLAEKKTAEEELKKFPDLEKIISLEKSIEQNEKREEEIMLQLRELMKKGDDTGELSREIQQISSNNEKSRKELVKLAKDKTSKELQSEKNDVERRLKNAEKNIEQGNRRIEVNNGTIQEQIKLRTLYIDLLKSVGTIYDVKILEEKTEAIQNEDGVYTDFVYEYADTISEKMVLVAVRFSQNQNNHFTFGSIDLVFYGVTQTYTFNLSQVMGNISETEISRKKKHTHIIESTKISYVKEWDLLVQKIDTSYLSEKVMLSGDLLRGLAFNSLTNYSGHIVKYSTKDNKLKISLELNQDSTNVVKPRFNEGNNYVILFGLSDDNSRRLIPFMMAKFLMKALRNDADMNRNLFNQFAISTQFLYSRDNVYLSMYPNFSLYEKIKDYYESITRSLSTDDEIILSDESSELHKQTIINIAKIIRQNFDSVRFTISTDSADFLIPFESLLFNRTQQPSLDSNMLSVLLLGEDNSAYYSLFQAGDTKSIQKKPLQTNGRVMNFSLQDISENLKDFSFYRDGQLYDGVYLVSRDVIEKRAIDVRERYFNPLYNMSLTYQALSIILNFLQAQNTQIIAATSADPVYSAEPKYLFNIESSTKGLMNDVEIESIDTLGNESIQEVENIINEFVAFYTI